MDDPKVYIINGTNNWWGSNDATVVQQRILDGNDVPGKSKLAYEPFKSNAGYTCEEAQNCNGQGFCIAPNVCKCMSGWTGANCDQFSCSNNCYGNGQCTGSNICSCNSGWAGDECLTPLCRTCSNHGICTEPDQCMCYTGYKSADCSQCADGYFGDGSNCHRCPPCLHGVCDKSSGKCMCSNPKWSGPLCSKCAEGLVGSNCEAIPFIMEVLPLSGADKGGTILAIHGHNFASDEQYQCIFGTDTVDAAWISSNQLECVTPKHNKEIVVLKFSEGIYTKESYNFEFFAKCGESDCGEMSNPKHGYCAFERCICLKTWKGENCEEQIIKPELKFEPPETVDEFAQMEFSYSFQGTEPITVDLLKSPKFCELDRQSRTVKWKPDGSVSSGTFQLQAKNPAGISSKEFEVSVNPLYTATIHSISATEALPYPQPVVVNGSVAGKFPKDKLGVPVIVRFKNVKTRLTKAIEGWVDLTYWKNFSVLYAPRQDEVGKIIVDAVHPMLKHQPFQEMASWNVLGMKLHPSSLRFSPYFEDLTGEELVSELENVGSEPIENVTYAMLTPLDAGVIQKIELLTGEANWKIERLSPGEKKPIKLLLATNTTVRGRVVFEIMSKRGTKTYLTVNLDIKKKKSSLILSPSSLTGSVMRGEPKYFDIVVKNEGNAVADDIIIQVPEAAAFTIVAAGKTSLKPGSNMSITLGYYQLEDANIGTYRGSLVLKTKDSATNLFYVLDVVSTNVGSYKVRVEDEYTYFHKDHPLVSQATIQIWNHSPGLPTQTLKKVTDTTGDVTFENVTEAFYNMLVTADDHSSWKGIVEIGPTNRNKTIFLQRVKVKVTFSVTKIELTDEYDITLETSFETRVPMPVVTMDPMLVDLQHLEEGRVKKVDFEFTNHGLIAAQNIRLVPPTTHPYLNFTAPSIIEVLPANTTYTVTMYVNRRTRVKRSSGRDCMFPLEAFFAYYCGGDPVSNKLEGKIKKPCFGNFGPGGGSTPGGGGVSTSKGSSITTTHSNPPTYAATSKLSCDCAKKLIQCLVSMYRYQRNVRKIVQKYVPCVKCTFFKKRRKRDLSEGSGKEIAADLSDATETRLNIFLATELIVGDAFNVTEEELFNQSLSFSSDDFGNNEVFASKMLQIILEITNGDAWKSLFWESMSESSQEKSKISLSERNSIIQTLKGEVHNKNETTGIASFIARWNYSKTSWESGITSENVSNPEAKMISYSKLSELRQAIGDGYNIAMAQGYSNVIDWYSDLSKQATDYLVHNDQEKGVCAVVRVRISQRAVLTREAFSALLEVDNSDDRMISDITIELQIWAANDGLRNSRLDSFSIIQPKPGSKLLGISSIDGEGFLPGETSGSAEWIIVPKHDAVFGTDAEDFYVGGSFSYTIGGFNTEIELTPGIIEVNALPLLYLHYFHEKYVYGDDPFTKHLIEPSVPFHLVVLVENKGNGAANKFRITSAQPKIIENEKGLLVNFTIIGTELGDLPVENSLTITFGDIPSKSIKMARWLMNSTLNGQFFNFTASFENVSPLGDQIVSLIEAVDYHELIKMVSDPSDAMKEHFLVNSKRDGASVPDTIFNSSTAKTNPVEFLNFSKISITGFSEYTIEFSVPEVNQSEEMWFYGRAYLLPDSNEISREDSLTMAASDENGKPLPPSNIWYTTSVTAKRPWISVVDRLKPSSRPNCCTYVVKYGQALNPTRTSTAPSTSTVISTSNSGVASSRLSSETIASTTPTMNDTDTTGTASSTESSTEKSTDSFPNATTPMFIEITTESTDTGGSATLVPNVTVPVSVTSITVNYTTTIEFTTGSDEISTLESSSVTSATTIVEKSTTTVTTSAEPVTNTDTGIISTNETSESTRLDTSTSMEYPTTTTTTTVGEGSTHSTDSLTTTEITIRTTSESSTPFINVNSVYSAQTKTTTLEVKVHWGRVQDRNLKKLIIRATNRVKFQVNGTKSDRHRHVTFNKPIQLIDGQTIVLQLMVLRGKSGTFRFETRAKLGDGQWLKQRFTVTIPQQLQVKKLDVDILGPGKRCVVIGETEINVYAKMQGRGRPYTLKPSDQITIVKGEAKTLWNKHDESLNMNYNISIAFGGEISQNKLSYTMRFEGVVNSTDQLVEREVSGRLRICMTGKCDLKCRMEEWFEHFTSEADDALEDLSDWFDNFGE